MALVVLMTCGCQKSMLIQPKMYTYPGDDKFFVSSEDTEYCWSDNEWKDLVEKANRGDPEAQMDVWWTIDTATRGREKPEHLLLDAARGGDPRAIRTIQVFLKETGRNGDVWKRWQKHLQYMGKDYDSVMRALENEITLKGKQ